MSIPTTAVTPEKVAAKLRKDARDVTFNDTYKVINPAFSSIVEQTASVLEFMNNSEVPADADLLMEFAYEIAHLFWRIAEGDLSPALDPIDRWLDEWFHGSYDPAD